jgi:hypothetical protein
VKIGRFISSWSFPRINHEQRLNIYLSYIFKALSGRDYFEYDGEPRYSLADIQLATIPKAVLVSIGELMLKRSTVDKTTKYDLISFTEFVQNFNSDEFRRWFSYIESIFFSNSHPGLDRLHMLSLYLRLFYNFLDRSIGDEKDTIPAFDHFSRKVKPHIHGKVRGDLEDINELTGTDLVKRFDGNSLTGLVGASVYTKHENKIGDMEGVSRSFIVVRGGIFYIHRYYIPVALIELCKDGKLYLKITTDQARKNYIRNIRPDRVTVLRYCKPCHFSSHMAFIFHHPGWLFSI